MKTLVAIIISTILLFANEQSLLNEYREQTFDKNINKDIMELLKNDPNYKKGIAYLYDKKLWKAKKVYADTEAAEHATKEELKKLKKVTVYYKPYKKAIKQFEFSVKNYKNPVSAYIGLKILTEHTMHISTTDMYLLRKLFAKALYQYSNSCKGYYEFGQILELGIATPPDKILALNIYQEGLKNCKKNMFYSIMFNANIKRVRRYLDARSGG